MPNLAELGKGIWLIAGFVLGTAGLLMLVMRRLYSTGHRRFQEGRVTGIVGRKGNGKTLFLTHEQLRHIGRKHYCRKCSKQTGVHTYHEGHVASNGVLKLPPAQAAYFHHVRGWADLLDLPHSTLVVLDEVHVDGWAPARQGEQLPPFVQWLLAQCRKLVLEVVWCAQREDRVSLGLRAQTDEIGMCVKGLWRRMVVRFYEPEDVQKARSTSRSSNGPVVKANWTYRYKVTKRVATAYDTYELLRPGQTDESPIDVKAAQDRIRAVMEGAGVSERSEDPPPSSSDETTAAPSPGAPVRVVRQRQAVRT